MKIPRNLSGNDLVKLLKRYDYYQTRQTGSHIRLTTQKNGEHHITIPKHKPLKVGTLNNILEDISRHLELSKKAITEEIFK